MNTNLSLPEPDDKAATKIAYLIYILYYLSLFCPPLAIASIVFAYIFENDAKTILASHYQYLIRSFWLSILYFGIAALLVIAVIGVFLIPICVIWWLIRLTKGLKSLMRNQPIINASTWIF